MSSALAAPKCVSVQVVNLITRAGDDSNDRVCVSLEERPMSHEEFMERRWPAATSVLWLVSFMSVCGVALWACVKTPLCADQG